MQNKKLCLHNIVCREIYKTEICNFGPVLEAYFKIFFITRYNTIVSIFLYDFISIINYLKKSFTIFSTILYCLCRITHTKMRAIGFIEFFKSPTPLTKILFREKRA